MRYFGLIADTWLMQVDTLIGFAGFQLAEFGVRMGLRSQRFVNLALIGSKIETCSMV